MIVDQGKPDLLIAQQSYLQGGNVKFYLNTTNTPDSSGNVLSSVTEPVWTGYVRVTPNYAATPTVPVPGGPAVVGFSPLPVFTNGSGSPVTFYCWGLADFNTNHLIAQTNIGLQTIPPGGSFVLNPLLTDNQL